MVGVILLDRDGVLNELVVHPEHGTVDSPMHPDQVQMIEGVPEALKILYQAGYELRIVTNQPSAAKGKTTLANLQAVHQRVVNLAEEAGARISSSHICFHRSEDRCECRKPKTKLLEEALALSSDHSTPSPCPTPYTDHRWMVGDGITDVQAGAALGLKTAFFGPRKCDACKIFDKVKTGPDFWGSSLVEFARYLTKIQSQPHLETTTL